MPKKYALLLLTIVEGFLLYIAVKGLLMEGVFSWHLKQPAFYSMITEIIILFSFLAILLIAVEKPVLKLIAGIIPVAIFCWLHMILLPILVATFYILYIWAVGKLFREKVFKIETAFNFGTEFLLGSGTLIALYCFLSAIKVGTIRNIQIFVFFSSLPLGIYVAVSMFRGRQEIYRKIKQTFHLNLHQALFVAGIITFFLIQGGRMNIAIDYDSYWYGLRSEYILENGKGIYENLGTVSLVYTYSKGLEVLTLPLSNLPSHSFMISFNLVLLALLLYICYKIVTLMVTKSCGLMTCLLIASVPGVTNMAITMKTDILTLIFQLLLLLYIMYYLQEEKAEYLVLGICAVLLSWTLKPTSMIFSTAVFGMSVIYLVITKRLRLKEIIRHLPLAFSSVGALLGIWARTFLLVGVPVTSTFSILFSKLGFQIKYPFAGIGVTNYSPSLFTKEGIEYLAAKMYGVFLNPSDERMNHIIIAWGTILIPFALLLIIAGFFFKKSLSKEVSDLKRYLYVVFLPLTLVTFASILILYRPDGNYFMLFYVMSLMLAGISLDHMKGHKLRVSVIVLLLPFLLFNVVFTALSNWGGSLGFSERKIVHKGYYDHEKEEHQQMIESGNEKIWDILSDDPRTRVIAIGYHPQVLLFPCSIQSYYDVWTWGNEELISSARAFLNYMDYAKTDYIYVQRGFVDNAPKYFTMLSRLLKEGILTDLVFEEGNMLAKVDISGKAGEQGMKNYEDFLEKYEFYEEFAK